MAISSTVAWEFDECNNLRYMTFGRLTDWFRDKLKYMDLTNCSFAEFWCWGRDILLDLQGLNLEMSSIDITSILQHYLTDKRTLQLVLELSEDQQDGIQQKVYYFKKTIEPTAGNSQFFWIVAIFKHYTVKELTWN